VTRVLFLLIPAWIDAEKVLNGDADKYCDVGEPFLVRGCCVEVAIDEVLGRWADFAQIGAVA
jgi:hypothetical protein